MSAGTIALALVAGFLVVANIGLVAVSEAFRLRETRREWLRAGAVRRYVRRWRSRTLRTALWFASWPHLFDHFLGSRRVRVMTTPSAVVWQQGRATVTRIGAHDAQRSGEPVLLVHSVVTRPWILDLLPDRSLANALVAAGRDVYLLDWGDPRRADARHDLAAHAEVLHEAVGAVAARSPTKRVHVVGYCMGATVALGALGAWTTNRVASLVLIAPPFDTQVPGGMAAVLQRPELMPVLALDEDGCVPAAYVREGFHLLRRQVLKGALVRLKRRKDADFQRVASALSRWAWEQRRVPGALWFDLVDLVRGNTMLRGELRLRDRRVDLSRITLPTLILVTDRDHIVPIASSLALTRHIRHAEVVRCPAGHVSMLMGRQSREVLVPSLLDWLRRTSGANLTGSIPAPVPPLALLQGSPPAPDRPRV